ncbi:MAG: YggS family pyridoxal phosphate-dependent enzyme [Spirochaetales bacterium]|nr:YggS family pyridoxal phosphate-dependent enzyme [Spirochaetales bacterium]
MNGNTVSAAGGMAPRPSAPPDAPGSPGYQKAIETAIEKVQERIRAASERAGRDPATIELLAVTKFHPVEAVVAAYTAGLRSFGENRVQEAEAKRMVLADSLKGARYHLLGHLQSNKARKAIGLFDCVQSVDSEAIIMELDKRAAALEKTIDILFELHTGEESKSGFENQDMMYRAMETAAGLPWLRPRGLMTMAPYTGDSDIIRASFRSCAAAFKKAKMLFDFDSFDTLSMGMTNDLELAIEEGSTMVRVGTAIFGERTYT